MAAHKVWRWRILEGETELAKSHEMSSRKACEEAINLVKTTAANSGPARYRERAQ